MRIDVMVLQDTSVAEIVGRARAVEEMGFGAVWVADHFVEPYRTEVAWHDAWTLLGALAVSTSRVRIGPLVSTPAFRNPAVLALQAATVDHLSDGRLELGVGAGGAPLDLAMTGSEPREPAERLGRLSELVSIVDALLTGGEVDHDGSFYRLAARIGLPVQRPRPPLVIGAVAPRALRLAAARADCVSTYASTGRVSDRVADREAAVEIMRERAAIIDAECARIGRPPESLRRSLLTFFGYLDPMPDRTRFLEWCAPYRELGFDEFVVYWPAEGRAALEALAG